MRAIYVMLLVDQKNGLECIEYGRDFIEQAVSYARGLKSPPTAPRPPRVRSLVAARAAVDWRLDRWIGPFQTESDASRFAAAWRAAKSPRSRALALAAEYNVTVYSFSPSHSPINNE